MKIAKWGNSYAVRLPVDIMRKAKLVEGDEVAVEYERGNIVVYGPIRRNADEVVAGLEALKNFFPADVSFDRDEANER